METRAVVEEDKVEPVEAPALVDPPSPFIEKPLTKFELAKRAAISSNVVLFGVQSNPSSSPAELLALSLLPSSTNAPAPVLAVRRPSNRTHPSPLVLTFADQADRAAYLLALKSIPGSPLSARHDLTPVQQQRRRSLVEKAKKRALEGGEKVMVRGSRLVAVAESTVVGETGSA